MARTRDLADPLDWLLRAPADAISPEVCQFVIEKLGVEPIVSLRELHVLMHVRHLEMIRAHPDEYMNLTPAVLFLGTVVDQPSETGLPIGSKLYGVIKKI